MPEIVRAVKLREKRVRNEYIKSNKSVKEEFSEQSYVNSDIKPLIKTYLRNIKEDLSNVKTGESSTYVKSLVEFRKLNKDFRRRAMTKFLDIYDREPDASNAKDLFKLTEIGKTFQEAFNK